MNKVKSGRLEYTGRAFDQDAQERMGNDIVNALVELFTNADDSYARLEATAQPVQGKIRIEVERHRKQGPTIIRVRDRAEGMTALDMQDRLGWLGRDTSGRALGAQVRGSRGRGAKDVVAFGPATWESVKRGEYHWFRLEPTGQWELGSRHATEELRKERGIGDGGTVVTVQVDSKRFPVPQHESLKKRLGHHFRLRLIMADAKRRVTLVNLNQRPRSKGDLLDYRYPEEYYRDKPLLEDKFAIPGYPRAVAHLQIWRHTEPFDESHLSAERQGGLLITSGRDIHDITLFDYDHEPSAARLFGTLDVPHIGVLAEEYDRRLADGKAHPENNPIPVLRVDHSLNDRHPFTKALNTAVTERLKPLVEQEKERERRARSTIADEDTDRRLQLLSKAASRFFTEKMRELDETIELPKGGYAAGSKPFVIIPPAAEIAEGEEKLFSVFLNKIPEDNTPFHVTVNVEGSGVSVSPASLVLNRTARDGRMVGSLKVKGTTAGTHNRIICRCSGYEADARVEVVEVNPARPLPDKFAFEKDQYFIVVKRTKRLKLFVPEHLRDLGTTVSVVSDRQEIVVRNQRVHISYRENGHGVGTVVVEGRQLHAHGWIGATLGNIEAKTRARVVTREPKGDLPFEFEPVDDFFGPQRARWEPPEGYHLEIAGRHPSVARYLGPKDKDFPGKSSLAYKVLLAEIVADSICRKLLAEVAPKRPDLYKNATVLEFYHEHQRILGEFVTVAHKTMLSDTELKSLDRSEEGIANT